MKWTVGLDPRAEVTINFSEQGEVAFQVMTQDDKVHEGLITVNQEGPVSGVLVIGITDGGLEPANATILVGDALVWKNNLNRTVQVFLD